MTFFVLGSVVHLPAAIFRSAIRAFPDIDEDWREYLFDRVIERINNWAQQENLEINLFELPRNTVTI